MYVYNFVLKCRCVVINSYMMQPRVNAKKVKKKISLLFSFAVPVVITAEDADEEGTDNAALRFGLLTSSPYAANFSLDPLSGELRPTAPLDFEQLPVTVDPADRMLEIPIRPVNIPKQFCLLTPKRAGGGVGGRICPPPLFFCNLLK